MRPVIKVKGGAWGLWPCWCGLQQAIPPAPGEKGVQAPSRQTEARS
jgi:hypothetical protein